MIEVGRQSEVKSEGEEEEMEASERRDGKVRCLEKDSVNN